MHRRKYDRHLIKWLSGGPRPAQQEEAHAHAPAALHAHWNARARPGEKMAESYESLTKLFKSFTSGQSSGGNQSGVQTPPTMNASSCKK